MRSPDKATLDVVIPCFNEEAVIPKLVSDLTAFASKLPVAIRFVFVDDGSSDQTAAQLDQICDKDERFACVHFSRNFGHQTAVTAGLRYTTGDMVAVIDADLQDPPEVIAEMIAKWREGYDVVYGVRKNRKEGILLRLAYSLFYRSLRRVSNVDLPLDAGDFSLMARRVVDDINRMPEHNRFVRGLRGWVGYRQIGLPYERQARQAGKPKYNLRRLYRLAADGIVNFSSVPLRLASWIGAMTSLLGFGLLVWAIFSALVTKRVPPGWASLAVMVLFFGGIQLIVLGIIGEYIGRIFEEVKNRPQFIISSMSGWVRNDAQPPSS